MITVFVALIVIAVYPYIIYPILGYCIIVIKKILISNNKTENTEANSSNTTLPHITLLITAYNEENFVDEKIKNIFELNYPSEKLEICWVTDGSTDKTPDIIAQYPQFKLLHQKERKGKVHAMQRAILEIDSPIIVFCDANTYLNKNAIKHIAQSFNNKKVGAVAGEKQVFYNMYDKASIAGEGFYWKYESALKKMDSKIYTVIGAAGELFAIRKELFEAVPNDTILDDFLITLKIASKRYKIEYAPEAIASEFGSADVKEEMKRKIRIAAGCFQVVVRNLWLFNVFKTPVLTLQFVSHKFMRWAITPLLMLILLPFNVVLAYFYQTPFILATLGIQLIFYTLTLLGYIIQDKNIQLKILFIPYYFFVTNAAQFRGFFRFLKGKSTVKWERAERVSKV